MFNAKILADSLSPDGIRLLTFEVTFPRIVLAEFNTHRMLSRNSASSRAIPVQKMIERVMTDPYIPSSWGKNQRGMQAEQDVTGKVGEAAREQWLYALDSAVAHAEELLRLGIHKQLTNRLLEPFMWHTIIVTATEWDNFFHLRNNPMAHPDIQIPAAMMQELYDNRRPRQLQYGQWHLPLVTLEESGDVLPNMELDGEEPLAIEDACKVSVGRCARISYLTHDGKRDLQADIELHDRLLESGHMSPFEHVARPAEPDDWKKPEADVIVGERIRYAQDIEIKDAGDGPYAWLPSALQWSGNFRGWVQYRKLIPGEADILGAQR